MPPPPPPSRLPVYVTLNSSCLTEAGLQAATEALVSIQASGVDGVAFDVWWGVVEAVQLQYNWAPFQRLVEAAAVMGLKSRVSLSFHASSNVGLPPWVLEAGQDNPDIFYTDRAGHRSPEYVSLGADDVSVLQGRTPIAAYRDLCEAFVQAFEPHLGSSITECVIGLGPDGELRYPSHPKDGRWSFPGVGEFQCFDRYMAAGLLACAHQAGQQHWGHGGPHDAGAYSLLPHQSGFFNHHGSWRSEYGRFFLQWYSAMLARHAERVTSVAAAAFRGRDVRLYSKLPSIHWWYQQPARPAELAAGIYNTFERDGYLPLLQTLRRHGFGVLLPRAELRNCDVAHGVLSDPEAQLLQMRAAATALHVPVSLENSATAAGADALRELWRKARDTPIAYGIECPQVASIVYNGVADGTAEPADQPALMQAVAELLRPATAAVRLAPEQETPPPALPAVSVAS